MTVCRPASPCIGGLLLLSVFLIALCGAVDLEGRWNEDQYKRTGLHSYLYAIGEKRTRFPPLLPTSFELGS